MLTTWFKYFLSYSKPKFELYSLNIRLNFHIQIFNLMGANESYHRRSKSISSHPTQTPHRQPSFLDAGCLGCFPTSNQTEFNIDHYELQTHNKELVPKGKVSQASIAYLSKEEIGFLKACSGKNISALRYYMNKGTNVNLLDEDRTSPLHVACRSGSLQVVEELINWGAAVNIADMAGWTPLHIAAFHQRSLVCHLLMKKGADPYLISRNGETPWDLVKDKSTEEVFYVHFDRAELKKMGRMKKDEPPGEIVDENILVNKREMNDRLFQNKLGVDLRRGGSIIEEEKESVSGIPSSRRFIEQDSRIVMSQNNLKEAIEAASVRSKITVTSHRNMLSTRDSAPRINVLQNQNKKVNTDRKENEPTNNRSNIFEFK